MSLVGISFEFPDLYSKLKNALPEINRFVAAQMQTNRGMLFDAEGAYNGHKKWAPLVLRHGQILSDRGNLRKSLAPTNAKGYPGRDGIVRFEGESITIGTRLVYASLMNDGTASLPGGVLRPVNAQALAIPLPAGKSATDTAKGLQRGSATKQQMVDKIALMERQLTLIEDPGKAAKLQERIRRYKSRAESTPKNQRVIFRKSVKIPARPFNTWTPEDEDELTEALTNKIAEVLNR